MKLIPYIAITILSIAAISLAAILATTAISSGEFEFPEGIEYGELREGHSVIYIKEKFFTPSASDVKSESNSIVISHIDGEIGVSLAVDAEDGPPYHTPISIDLREGREDFRVSYFDSKSHENIIIDKNGDGIPDIKLSREEGKFTLDEIVWKRDENWSEEKTLELNERLDDMIEESINRNLK